MSTREADHKIRTELAARYPLLYLVSWEEERLVDKLKSLAGGMYERILVWSLSRGFVGGREEARQEHKDPRGALHFIHGQSGKALYILLDFHFYLSDALTIRLVKDNLQRLQATGSSRSSTPRSTGPLPAARS